MNQRYITFDDALARLNRGEISLPPATFSVLAATSATRRTQPDALLCVSWCNKNYQFALEYASLNTPRIFRAAINQILHHTKNINTDNVSGRIYPMVWMPYLAPEQLAYLESIQVSGLDLCGNGIIIVPEELLIFRTGTPNRFPSSAPIKNVYRGDSSLAARVFLLRPEYQQVGEIQAEIQRHGATLSLATVSKVLKQLEEDLMVTRNNGNIRLLQPEDLIQQLVDNYTPPRLRQSLRGRVPGSIEQFMRILTDRAAAHKIKIALTGVGSTNAYTTMERGQTLSLYCTDAKSLLADTDFVETKRFPNVEVHETDNQSVYFDIRRQGDIPCASPIQTLLELSHAGERERETARDVRKLILHNISG